MTRRSRARGQLPSERRARRPAWRGLALAAVLVTVAAPSADAFDLYRVDGAGQFTAVNGPSGTCPSAPRPRAVLFVHGHELGSSGSGGSYQDNFTAASGPSFAGALARTENQDLGIEAYYIQMREANRSIFVDAQRIGQAIALIQACQDPTGPASVRVAIIGYSKGTISTRVYLRSRQADLSADFPGEIALDPPGASPVSEFVALAPPNHGLRAVALLDGELPIRQLNDGVRRLGCTSYNEPLATGFMSRLNGTANGQWTGAQETPGNRASGAPVADGTLFVALYATGDRDLVGGDSPNPDNDCNVPPRKQARNLGTNAVNLAIDVPAPSGSTQGIEVHRATVKHADVICRTLYTVVNHRAPDVAAPACPTTADGNPIVPFGSAITLVLDHSGSMATPACPTCPSKQRVLRDAVEIFLNLWLAVAGSKDRIGITYFRTNVSQYAAPGPGDTLVPVQPDVAALVADLENNATTSSGLTAMGGGLQSAILQLQGAAGPLATVGPNRNIILFTDGLQNVNPAVQALGPGLVIANQPGGVDAGIPTLLAQPIDTYGVRIHTIGIGPGVVQPSQTILGTIATTTGGVSRFDMDAAALQQFFTMSLMDALAASSPQLVAYRRSTLAGEEAVEAFPVTAGVGKVALQLSWPRGATLDLRVEKDGVDVTASGRTITGPFYRIFSIALPAGAVRTGGEWRLRIRGQRGIAYQAAAIVDDHRRSAHARFAGRDHRAGDALEVRLELRDGVDAVRGATVTATVLRPTESVANLLAAFPARTVPIPELEPLAPAGQRAVAQLLQDERRWTRLLPTATTIRLEDDGKGIYRATLPAATVPGVYTVVFDAAARAEGGGELRRAGAISTVVRVGPAKAETSGVRVVPRAAGAREREAEILLSPRDAFGNHLGPGLAAAVAITVGDGAELGQVRDLDNGTYAAHLVLAEGADPNVTVSIAGEPLTAGRISSLAPPRRSGRLFSWVGIVAVGWIGALVLVLLTRRPRERGNP